MKSAVGGVKPTRLGTVLDPASHLTFPAPSQEHSDIEGKLSQLEKATTTFMILDL
jgi:hypothetical protein